MSGERSADLFGRSAACSWDLKLRRCPRAGALGLRQIDNEKPRTYRTGPRYARLLVTCHSSLVTALRRSLCLSSKSHP